MKIKTVDCLHNNIMSIIKRYKGETCLCIDRMLDYDYCSPYNNKVGNLFYSNLFLSEVKKCHIWCYRE